MNDLRKAAQDVIDCVDSPYIPDEIRMVDVKCIEALRKAVQAEQDVPVYTPMTDDELRGIAVRNFTYNNEEFTRNIERAVIKRLGLRWPE